MPTPVRSVTLATVFILLLIAAMAAARAAGPAAASQGTAVRQIPGITTKDAYPNGCVDCHVAGKEGDLRMSTLMAKWTSAPSPALVEKARAASAVPAKIKGKHLPVPNVKANVPQTCLAACHKKGSTIAPPFAQLMHTIHLVGGSQNRFMTANQGECMHCHKLDQKTGTWKVASGPER
jgi:hypothetical protein